MKMDINDYVFIINPTDPCYGQKGIIRGVAVEFSGKITGYTVTGENGQWRDYHPTDLQYTTLTRKTFTSQMQLL
jgi:hypothetical protein